MDNIKFLATLFLVIVFTHVIGTWRDWYWNLSWLDIPMHFLGGFFIAVFFLWIRKNLPFLVGKNNFFVDFIIILGFVALIGVLWEFFEYFLDYFFANRGVMPLSQVSLQDTLGDLFFDLVGGFSARLIHSALSSLKVNS
ncbi:MAG: hypothetical protein PHZ25_01105 [Candidatus Pacebacteria bacterium]|nr:hypothetical protein [Candidatus Paceibacterota bacterium]